MSTKETKAHSMHVNVTTKVNSKKIRREVHNGREHIVIPSYTLPADVIMNGGLYPASEIDAHFEKLEGTLAPLGHPQLDGKFISAFSPEGINVGHIGAFNRNVKKSGNRVYVEKWLDVDFAKNTEGGRRLIERIEAFEAGDDVSPIHTSVAVFLNQLEATPEQREAGASWVAKIVNIDHDAILLDEPGAATPEQGVGLLVNADASIAPAPNEKAFKTESFRSIERKLDEAAREKFKDAESVWVVDFTTDEVIIVVDNEAAKLFSYSTVDEKIKLGDNYENVHREESWYKSISNAVKRLFNAPKAEIKQEEPEDMALTPEEKTELTSEIVSAVTEAFADRFKSIDDKFEALNTNSEKIKAELEANKKSEEDAKRAEVAAVFGEIVANALSGDALNEMHEKIGKSQPLSTGQIKANAADDFAALIENLPKE